MNTALLNSLLQGIQFSDPRLHDLLRALIKRVGDVSTQQELQVISEIEEPPTPGYIPRVESFTYHFTKTNVVFTWSAPTLGGNFFYEIRKGTDWDTAERIVITSTFSIQIDPLPIGIHKFLIKTMDIDGNYQLGAPRETNVVVPELGAFSVSAQVIDNNVLLSWTEPTSVFRLDYYDVRKNSVSLGIVYATFKAIFESVAGTYTYEVIPYDIIGNSGVSASVSADVRQPPDYELQDDHTSSFDGTKNQVVLLENDLVVNIPPVTYQGHFTDSGWQSPQDQIDDNFPYWLQPGELTGTYTETKDYGAVINGIIATLTWNTVVISGQGHTILAEMRSSTDNQTWTDWVSGVTQFIASLRYLEFRLTFTAVD